MNSLFEFQNNEYRIPNLQLLSTLPRKTAIHRLEAIKYSAPFLCVKLPSEYKFADLIDKVSKKFRCRKCKCDLRKKQQQQVGFLKYEWKSPVKQLLFVKQNYVKILLFMFFEIGNHCLLYINTDAIFSFKANRNTQRPIWPIYNLNLSVKRKCGYIIWYFNAFSWAKARY